MSSLFTPKSSQKPATKIQLVALTAVLLLALLILPVSADQVHEVADISAHDDAAGGADADSARLTALGEYYTAQRLEASHAASTDRYVALASFFGQAGSVAIVQDAAFLAANPEFKSFSPSAVASSDFYAENPEAKYASGWGGNSAAAAGSGTGSENPELSAFQQYCGC